MTGPGHQPFPALAINMNQPGTLLHWSIFDVTVANLVLIAVMVVIFGAALLLPFPRGDREELAPVTGMATDGAIGNGTAAVSDRLMTVRSACGRPGCGASTPMGAKKA